MLKTCKIITKRVKVKPRTGKVLRKKSGQGHYNSKDSGDVRRSKRPAKFFNKQAAKKIISLTQ
ncbi:MAG: hypothetical protein U9Q72_00995 [Patescibacteria group bacterium]|nr:hypothetical protein [Patescibacteria group bacterium]